MEVSVSMQDEAYHALERDMAEFRNHLLDDNMIVKTITEYL